MNIELAQKLDAIDFALSQLAQGDVVAEIVTQYAGYTITAATFRNRSNQSSGASAVMQTSWKVNGKRVARSEVQAQIKK